MDLLRDNLPANLETDEITELPGEAALLLAEEAVNRIDEQFFGHISLDRSLPLPAVPGLFLLPNCCGGLSTLSLDPLDF